MDNQSFDDADEKAIKLQKKRVRRVPKGGSSSRAGSGLTLPTAIVCSPSEVAQRPGAVEAGLVVSGLVLLLYFVGCYETFLSLPDVPTMPAFRDHLGENLNMALNGFDTTIARLAANKVSKTGAKAENPDALENKGEAAAEAVGNVVIPKAQWPVTIKGTEAAWETIIHPGDLKTKMVVPPFWSRPVHQNKLMSRETAMEIGSCAKPSPSGEFARGDDCPLEQRTIFIQIASYRDFQCRLTVESAFNRAQYPERIRVGVVDQIVAGEDIKCDEPVEPCETNPNQALCKYRSQIDVYEMRADLSVGPVFARHIGYRLYRGEYYATQSDAHVSFTTAWDADIIAQIEATKNEMAVLSTYLTDVQGSIDEQGHSTRDTRPIMCNTAFEGGPQGMHLRHFSQVRKKNSSVAIAHPQNSVIAHPQNSVILSLTPKCLSCHGSCCLDNSSQRSIPESSISHSCNHGGRRVIASPEVILLSTFLTIYTNP
jgi:Glycosyltransferase (GlcNAc)